MSSRVYTGNVLHKFLQMAVASAALAHAAKQRTLRSVKVTYSEVGAKKVPQNSVLRTMIVPSSCSADTIKRGGFLQLFLEL